MSTQELDVRVGRLEIKVEAVSTSVEMQNRILDMMQDRMNAFERRMDAFECRMDEGFRELRKQIFWLGGVQISCLLAMLGLVAKIGHLF